MELDEYVAVRGRALLRTAYMLCGDRYLAEDLVQEVPARVHRRSKRQDIEHLDAYLRAAVVRQFLSWRRRRGRQRGAAVALHLGPIPDYSWLG
jgi:DNA-directed RNA polymerase specialized sigma24 family protein